MSTSLRSQYPSLDPAWADELLRELVIRGARGPVVGDVLATADEHCRFSGEGAVEAFGPARAYADQVPLRPQDRDDRSARTQLGLAAPSVLGLAGMVLAFATFDAWRAGSSVPVTWNHVLGVVVCLGVALLLVVVHPEWILRRPWVGALVMSLALCLLVAMALLPLPVLAHLSVTAGTGLAIALLAAGAWWTRAQREPAAPVAHPTQGDPSPRATRALVAAQPWFFIGITLVGLGLVALLPAS